MTFAILVITFIQSAKEYHIIDFCGFLDGITDKFIRRTFLCKILTCSHSIVCPRSITYISSLVIYLNGIAQT